MYKNCNIFIKYTQFGDPIEVDNITQIHKELLIETKDDNLKILEEFLRECYNYYSNVVLERSVKVNKINYYLWDDFWDNIQSKKRSLDTLCFSNNLHYNLLNNIKQFLSPERRS